MAYRKEIDGLRAVAVIPVILFHAGYEFFRGGYVGVDVFFVISGYLITTIILTENEKGTFSLVDFYERRLRRIIPALYLVMLVSIICSWLWLIPSHMKDFSESLLAVSFFSSNILFWKETGYWGTENELKPLLHTWSLSVEEQYYILFPLLLVLMWRFPRRCILISFFIVSLSSLALSHWFSSSQPSANFFLLPTRVWELAIGAFIAIYSLYCKSSLQSLTSYKVVNETFSWSGLALIAYAVLVFDDTTPFPGLHALVPTTGTALIIIFSSKATLSNRFLSSGIIVGLGFISYSAYLWHQPLFAFARHKSIDEVPPVTFGVLSILSLALAFFTWKYIENPIRKRRIFPGKQIVWFTVIFSTGFVTFAMIGYLSDGYKFRFDKTTIDSVNRAGKVSFSNNLCEKSDIKSLRSHTYCVLVPNTEKLAILYGDSHAMALMFEAQQAFRKTGYGLLFKATSACPPVKDVYRADNPDKKACYEQNTKVYEDIANDPSIEYVILTARWTLGMEGVRFDNKEGGTEHGRKPHLDIVDNGRYLMHEDYSHRELIAEAYKNSIRHLLDNQKKVFLIYPVPEAGWHVPDYITKYSLIKPQSVFNAATASTSHQVFLERNKRTIDALDQIEPHEHLHRIFPEKIFCDNSLSGRCITHKNRVIFYRDDDHLSDEGAKLILQKITGKITL